jgi:hypothetical protein
MSDFAKQANKAYLDGSRSIDGQAGKVIENE